MIIIKSKQLLLLITVLCFFCTTLLAQPQKNSIKNIHETITHILSVELTDKNLNDSTLRSTEIKNKLNKLKGNLEKFKDTSVTSFKQLLKNIQDYNPGKKQKDTISSKLPKLQEYIQSLKTQVEVFLASAPGASQKSSNQTVNNGSNTTVIKTPPFDMPKKDTLPKTINKDLGTNEEDRISQVTLDSLKTRYNELEIDFKSLKKNEGAQNSLIENINKSKDYQQKIFALLLFIFLSITIIFFFFKNKTLKKLKLEYTKLNAVHLNLTDNLKPKNDSSPLVQRVTEPVGEITYKAQVDIVQQPALSFISNLPIKGKYFFAEAMVTAGPRKNFEADAKEGDFGLGEDVAGLIIKNDKAFFWVLDGTSDSDKVTKPLFTNDTREDEYFSSRLLAQSIGWNLQQIIANKLPSKFNATHLLQQAIAVTEREWQNKIAQLDSASRESLLNTLFDKNGILQCSTTAVFGVLCLDGRLDACRIGDTKIIAQPGESDFAKSTGRQFATLQQTSDTVNLSFNDFSDVRSQSIQLNNISTLLVMTDGISNQMESWLKSSSLNFTDKNTREIVARFKQKTYDDKALCIIQIKSES